MKDRFAVDTVVSGKVTRLVDFGAFVELEPGLEGLIHISELDNRVRTAGDVVKEGQEVKVRVLEVDKDARRVSLSLRRAQRTGRRPGRTGRRTGRRASRRQEEKATRAARRPRLELVTSSV